MRNRLIGILTSVTAAGLLWAAPASAVPIYSASFTAADNATVGNGWAEIEQDADDVAIVSNMLQLRDNNSNGAPLSAAALQTISTTGFSNITLSFDWAALEPSDEGDQLIAEWRTGNVAWTIATGGTSLATLDLGGSTSLAGSGVLNLGAAADNLANIQIRFRTNVSNGANGDVEGAVVDNVLVSGSAITAQVPEPLTVSLFGAGLVGVYAARRRKDKKV